MPPHLIKEGHCTYQVRQLFPPHAKTSLISTGVRTFQAVAWKGQPIDQARRRTILSEMFPSSRAARNQGSHK